MITIYLVFFSYLSFLNHDYFLTNGFDLGIFDYAAWNNLHGASLINPTPASSAEAVYIQNNRDYFASASKPAVLSSYVQYTYPHPLRNPTTGVPPASPTNLRVQ